MLSASSVRLAKRYKFILCITLAALLNLWVYQKATSVTLPSKDSPLLFYSNQAQDDLHLLYKKAIGEAKEEIILQMYAVSDPLLLQTLVAKASSGVRVALFYDPDSCHIISYPFAYPVHTSGLMHRKIAIIDRSKVYIGTANLTPPSLHFHDNLVAGLYNPNLASFLISCPTNHFDSFWLLPDRNREALDALLNRIHSAVKTIKVAMFTLTHPELIEALIEAKKRGVDVICAVDYYTTQGASSSAIENLRSAGVALHQSQGRQLLHHKWAWIDENTLILGSANWTLAAFQKNQDCFIIISDLDKTHRKVLANIWRRIVLEAKSNM